MVVHKRKKNSRMRGSKTHGWGSMKKHRGHGHRGGSGMGGTGKKADAKKPSIWKDVDYFGKHGFVPKTGVTLTSVTLQYLDEQIEKLVAHGLAKGSAGSYEINVAVLGCNKVVGTGKATKKLAVTADYFSASAIEKIEAAGGKAILTGNAAPTRKERQAAGKEAKEKAAAK